MNTDTFPKIAEALRAVAALLDEAAEGVARAAAAQPELPITTKPAPQGCAPEGVAPPEGQVSAPAAAAAEPATTPRQPTFDEAKGAVLNFASTLGAEATKALLAEFGAQRLTEVPEPQWGSLVAAAVKKLEAHTFGDAPAAQGGVA